MLRFGSCGQHLDAEAQTLWVSVLRLMHCGFPCFECECFAAGGAAVHGAENAEPIQLSARRRHHPRLHDALSVRCPTSSMMVLGGGAISFERGTPVLSSMIQFFLRISIHDHPNVCERQDGSALVLISQNVLILVDDTTLASMTLCLPGVSPALRI